MHTRDERSGNKTNWWCALCSLHWSGHNGNSFFNYAGYAFVQFTSYFSAKKALEGMNAKKIRGRPVAMDWVVPKEKYEQSLEGKRTDREGRGVQDGEGEDGGGESDSSSDQSLEERKEELEMEEGQSDDSDSAGSGEESDSSDSEGVTEGCRPQECISTAKQLQIVPYYSIVAWNSNYCNQNIPFPNAFK